MNLSELPALRDYRNELARKIHKKRGGDYLTAVQEANATCRSIYAKATGGGRKLSERAVRESVARTVAGVQRGTVTLPSRGGKGKRKKDRDAALKETISRAISKAVTEAASPPRVPAAPPSAPLTEMTDDELAGRIAEVSFATASAARVTESTGTPDPAGAASDPGGPLHEMDFESFEEHAAAVLTGQNGAGLRSPFWAGSDAPRSPFWRDLDGR